MPYRSRTLHSTTCLSTTPYGSCATRKSARMSTPAGSAAGTAEKEALMNRMMAIVEREMRKFVRSPALMLVAMVLPIVQLIVLGNAFGGKIHDARLGIVDHDRTLIQGVETDRPQALRIREALNAIHANARTLDAVDYSNEKTAIEDVHNGKIDGVVIIPANYSRDVYMGRQPRIGLVLDNSDNFMTPTLDQNLNELVVALNQHPVKPLLVQQIPLNLLTLYPSIHNTK